MRKTALSSAMKRSDVFSLSGISGISIARGDVHDAAVDDNRVLRVNLDRLSGAYQRHLAPVETNLDLSIFNDHLLAAVRPPGFLYLQFIRLRVRILQGGCKYS
jgi:hypothetical protein